MQSEPIIPDLGQAMQLVERMTEQRIQEAPRMDQFMREYQFYQNILVFLIYDQGIDIDPEPIEEKQGFHRDLVAVVLYNGWFMFSIENVFLPKLDYQSRTFLRLDQVTGPGMLDYIQSMTSSAQIKYRPLAKRIRRLFNQDQGRFTIRINHDLPTINTRNTKFHGQSWIEEDLVGLLVSLQKEPVQYPGGGVLQGMCWGVYEGDNLVAADIGYSVGSIYVSMSGFSDRAYPSMGALHLLAQALLLRQMGYSYWDMGMGMEYKESFMTSTKNQQGTLDIYRKHRQDIVHVLDTPLDIASVLEDTRPYLQNKHYKPSKAKLRKSHEHYAKRKELERTRPVDSWNQDEVRLWLDSMLFGEQSAQVQDGSQLGQELLMDTKNKNKRVKWAYQRLKIWQNTGL